MTRNATLIVVLLVVASLVAAPVAAAAGGFGAADEHENAAVQPGEKLSGVVNVQQAEFEGEVDERTFGVKTATAETDEARADVVAQQLEDVDRRLDEIEQRKDELREKRENGEITEGEYRAGMAELNARTETTKRLANATEATANGLPADVLADKGIDVEAIQTLRDRADELSGPEVAEIARSIAGPDVGKSMAGAQQPDEIADKIPDDAGPGDRGPGDAGSGGDTPTPDDGSSETPDEEYPNGTDRGQPDETDSGAS